MINYKLIAIIAIAGILLGNIYVLAMIVPALIYRLIVSAAIYSVKQEYEGFSNKLKQQVLQRNIRELNDYLIIRILSLLSNIGIVISFCYVTYLISIKFFGVADLIKFAIM